MKYSSIDTKLKFLCLFENPLLHKENMSSCLVIHTIKNFVSLSQSAPQISSSLFPTNKHPSYVYMKDIYFFIDT